ncbi:MAG: glycosyltransferase family 4 protein [Oscillospiraceae bacterium]|nr:glycosyltransferase family 4 protein [Oscillospiraceae bacterium]
MKRKELSKIIDIGQVESRETTYEKFLPHRKLRLLLFHNTLPEYRIGWFKELSKIAECEFVFTNESLAKKNYGFDIDYERTKGINCLFLFDGKEGILQLMSILKDIQKYDFVELPPIDSPREVIYGQMIVNACKKYNVRLGYFWEKWEAPLNKQPIKRRIKNWILRVVPKMIYKKADIIYAAGTKSREYFISNGIDEEKINIIPNVSETPPCEYINIKAKYGIPENKTIIMFLGRLMPQKGVQRLIRAFSMLDEKKRNQSHLLIVGNGDDKTICEKLASDLKVSNITFTGAVEPQARGNYFSQCDIFVYPVTYYDGRVDVWGLTLNEAVQHGKVVIATDAVGSAYELIEDGVNGFRVEPDNIKELSTAVNKSLDYKIAHSAEIKDKHLMEVYNSKCMAHRYIELAEQLIFK